MSRFSIVIGFLLVGVSCATSKMKYGQHSISLSDREIIYFLEKGDSEGKAGTLLLALQGSDCNSVSSDKFIGDVRLNFRKFDLVFIEKPGITPALKYNSNPEREDCPQSYLQTDNPERRALDASAVIQEIQSEYKYKNTVVLGGSEGGLVSVILAALDDQVSAVITVNGGGARFINDVLHNIRVTSAPEKREEDLSGFKGFANYIANSDPSPMVVSNHGFLWWRVTLSLDQSEYLKKIRVPVLVVQSENDESVSPAHTFEMVKDIQNLGYSNLELITCPNLNHALINPGGKSHNVKVLNDIENWIYRVLPAKP